MKKLSVILWAFLAVGLVGADTIPWPSDFAEQVAATHPAPSGTQIATSAALAVDARLAATSDAQAPIAAVEGRATSEGLSNEAAIDARKPSGLFLVFR